MQGSRAHEPANAETVALCVRDTLEFYPGRTLLSQPRHSLVSASSPRCPPARGHLRRADSDATS